MRFQRQCQAVQPCGSPVASLSHFLRLVNRYLP
ncbi:toxin bmkK4/beta scaffold [Caudoviricetes sp.]|nr:toxin bmkK4/beta scaffold [Caudoviricetes sp.]